MSRSSSPTVRRSTAAGTAPVPTGAGAVPGRPRRRRPRHHIVVMLAPAVILYTVFSVYPLLDSIRLSMFTVEGGQEVFAGLTNFTTLFGDEFLSARFWNALGNNMLFFLIHLGVETPMGLLLAALLTTRQFRGLAFFRSALFIPTTLSVVIVGFIWQLILNPVWGFVETPWLGLESTALPTVTLISVWQYVGIPMVFFYAALIRIPAELVEAAYMDGASDWQVFWRVKLPLIAPMVGIIAIVTYIYNMRAFDLIYTVKGALAGPNYATDIFGTLFYRTFFGDQFTVGSSTLGATVATLMFLVILAGVGVYLLFVQRRLTSYEY